MVKETIPVHGISKLWLEVFGDGSVAGALCHWALAVDPAESDWYARKVRESGGGIYPIPWGHYIDDPDGNLGELWTGSAWPHSRRGPRWGEEISPAAAIVEVSLLMTNQAQALHLVLLGISQAESVSAGLNVWTSNGPEGGSINALAIDPVTPTTLYAGTLGGGVFSIQQVELRTYLPLIQRGQ
jgi:hypothetical protein